MSSTVTTMIVNETQQPLTMKVGNRNHFFRLARVKIGGEYAMEICVDWTYQEFMLEDKRGAGKKLFVNSDDCCDYERITVKESGDSDGKLLGIKVPRKQFSEPEEEVVGAKKGKIFNWRFWM